MDYSVLIMDYSVRIMDYSVPIRIMDYSVRIMEISASGRVGGGVRVHDSTMYNVLYVGTYSK